MFYGGSFHGTSIYFTDRKLKLAKLKIEISRQRRKGKIKWGLWTAIGVDIKFSVWFLTGINIKDV